MAEGPADLSKLQENDKQLPEDNFGSAEGEDIHPKHKGNNYF